MTGIELISSIEAIGADATMEAIDESYQERRKERDRKWDRENCIDRLRWTLAVGFALCALTGFTMLCSHYYQCHVREVNGYLAACAAGNDIECERGVSAETSRDDGTTKYGRIMLHAYKQRTGHELPPLPRGM